MGVSIGELIEALKVNDAIFKHKGVPREPREAMNSLIEIGEPAVEPLLQLLTDTETWSHIYAIKVLGEIRAEKAVRRLIELIDGEYFSGFDDALEALQKIGLPAVEPMLHYLGNKKDTRENISIISALEVLEKIKDERVYEALVDTLSYPDEEVQEATIASLGEYGDERAVEHLSRFLDDEEFRDEAKEAIRSLLYEINPKKYRNMLAMHGIIGEARVASLDERIGLLLRDMRYAYEFEKKFDGDDAQKLNDITREHRMSESLEKILQESIELAVDEALISNRIFRQMKRAVTKLQERRWAFERQHEEELNMADWRVPHPVKEEKRSYKGLVRTGMDPNPRLDELCKRIWEWLKIQQFLVTKRNRTLWGRKGDRNSRKGCYIHLGKDEEKTRTWGLVHLIVWGNAWTAGEAETFTESFWDFVETSGLVKTELRWKDLHTRKDAIIFMKIHGIKPCYGQDGLYFRPHVGGKKRRLLDDLLNIDSKEAAKNLREKYEL